MDESDQASLEKAFQANNLLPTTTTNGRNGLVNNHVTDDKGHTPKQKTKVAAKDKESPTKRVKDASKRTGKTKSVKPPPLENNEQVSCFNFHFVLFNLLSLAFAIGFCEHILGKFYCLIQDDWYS